LINDREAFVKLIVPYIESVWVGLQKIQDSEIRMHSFAFFYNVSYCLQEEFKPFLETLMTMIVETIESEEYKKKPQVTFSLDSDSEDEDDEDGYYAPKNDVRVELIEEKGTAIIAMGELAKACPLLFVPYFPKAIQVLAKIDDFYQAKIRMQAVVCYKDLVVGLVEASNEGKVPKYTCGVPCNQRFNDQVGEFINKKYFPRMIDYLVNEDSYEVSACTLETLEEAVKLLGPAFIDRSAVRLMEALNELLLNKGLCQKGNEGDSDDVDMNGLIFGNITDLLVSMAKVLRETVMPKLTK